MVSEEKIEECLNTSINDMPPPDSSKAVKIACGRLRRIIDILECEGTIEPKEMIPELAYSAEVLSILSEKLEDDDDKNDDDMPTLKEDVPDEVREWLATFASNDKADVEMTERPSFRSIANAIRTGIFIEKIYQKMSTSQLIVYPKPVEDFLKTSNDWNFDTFSYAKLCNGSPLKYIGYYLLEEHGCLKKFKIPPPSLEALLGYIEIGYAHKSNPYHNNLHACDVLQTTHWFITQTGIKDWLSDLEIFSLLFSAIIHDYDHSGTTNNFHIQSTSNLAVLYNDKSVLENHHVAQFFRTMLDNDCSILVNLSKSEYKEFRSMMIDMVLHTDMSHHFSQVKDMKTIITLAKEGNRAFKHWKKLKHGRLIAPPGPYRKHYPPFEKSRVMSLILHTCDISHPAKGWDTHYQWTQRCMDEFFLQGDLEQEKGLDFSPLCDREKTAVPMSQIGFIDFIVNPTLEVTGEVISLVLHKENPSKEERPWETEIASNKTKWRALVDSGQTKIEPSDCGSDVAPPPVKPMNSDLPEDDQDQSDSPRPNSDDPLDNSHLIKQMGPIVFDSEPPAFPTKHKDVMNEIPSSVISRPGSPHVWDFGAKESITSKPPRPNSAVVPSPPQRRRAPISVDHRLRRHALDF